MLISKLHLLQFKNYEDQTFQFHQRFNCLVGLNGMGKTNVLDAIHYLAFTKSALNNTDSQNIMHDMNYFSVRGVFDAPNVEEVSCYFERGGGKTFKVNKLAPEKLAEHIGKIPLVITTPYDQGLILEGSEGRRKFVDGTISQFDGSFLKSLLKYQKNASAAKRGPQKQPHYEAPVPGSLTRYLRRGNNTAFAGHCHSPGRVDRWIRAFLR